MEPLPVRVEARCSVCRGDVSISNQVASGSRRVDDGATASTSSGSSTPTGGGTSNVRLSSTTFRNVSTQHRGLH